MIDSVFTVCSSFTVLLYMWMCTSYDEGDQSLVKSIILFGVSLSCVASFSSAHMQVLGLFGQDGLIPLTVTLSTVKDFLDAEKTRSGIGFGPESIMYWMLSLVFEKFYFPKDQDNHLLWITKIDIMLSFISMVYPHPVLFAYLYVSYYGIKRIGGRFYNFQWDALLLEVLVLAMLLSMSYDSSTTRVCLWLVRILLFRLMFGSGVVKLFSRDPSWNTDFSAMSYHFLTQPLPSRVGYFLHILTPKLVFGIVTVLSLVVEVLVPLLSLPNVKGFDVFVFTSYTLLQVGISAAGYYGKLLCKLLIFFRFYFIFVFDVFYSRIFQFVDGRAGFQFAQRLPAPCRSVYCFWTGARDSVV
jgi:hypothetical protein